MRLTDIGHQLKAFRMESGLKADEIANRLGISRAALYRYEKGEVIKLDTVQRLAELLQVSPLSLRGIGVEYYQRLPAFFERLRTIEETADTILVVGDGASFLWGAEAFATLVVERSRREAESLRAVDQAAPAICEATIESLEARRLTFARRQPTLVVLMSAADIEHLTLLPFRPGLPHDPDFRARCQRLVDVEIERLAAMMESPPLGIQLGMLRPTDQPASFRLMRQRDRTMLSINPFRASGSCIQNGVAIVTGAPEAVTPHQRVAETLWRTALRGQDAVATIRDAHARALATIAADA